MMAGLKAKIGANNEKFESLRTTSFLSWMDIHQARIESTQEEIKTKMVLHQEKMDAQLKEMEACQKETMACQEVMEACLEKTEAYLKRTEQTPEEIEAIVGYQEAPNRRGHSGNCQSTEGLV
jgi:hypothetical protein